MALKVTLFGHHFVPLPNLPLYYSGFQLTLAARVWKYLGNLGTTFQNSRFHCYWWQSNCELWNENHEFDLEVRFEICKLRFQVGKAAVGMMCAEGDESDKSWLSTLKHQTDSETFTWIYFNLMTVYNLLFKLKQGDCYMRNDQQGCYSRKVEKKKINWIQSEKLKYAVKTVFLLWLWPLFT